MVLDAVVASAAATSAATATEAGEDEVVELFKASLFSLLLLLLFFSASSLVFDSISTKDWDLTLLEKEEEEEEEAVVPEAPSPLAPPVTSSPTGVGVAGGEEVVDEGLEAKRCAGSSGGGG